MFLSRILAFHKILIGILIGLFLLLSSGCTGAFLQSRRFKKPFPSASSETCSSLRKNLFKLRTDTRANTLGERGQEEILRSMGLSGHAVNTNPISTPREKMDLLVSSDLLVNEREIWTFIEEVDKLDILGIRCRDIAETLSPGVGEGLLYTDFYRVGEDYTAYLVFRDEKLYMVFSPNSEPVDEHDRETILSLLGHASRTAVREGIEAGIP